jgi:hypothetical protein
MVYRCGCHKLAFFLAGDTEGMLPKIGGTGLMPPGIISTVSGSTSLGIIQTAGFG